jgi:glutamate synthase domain-containing protein 2
LPLRDAIAVMDNALRRFGLRDTITLIASGRIATGADAATYIALGADLVHIGRGFLFSIGCIQALRCHTNTCPTGVATQNEWLQSGLDPADKAVRVRNYSLAIERDLQMITHACGLRHPGELNRSHVVVSVGPGVRKSLLELYPYPDHPSSLFGGNRRPSTSASRERVTAMSTGRATV